MDNSLPLVSIYTCVYNGEKTLDRVFNSVKNLTYSNIEHIIVNDGSTDKTEELVLRYIEESPYPVKYLKKENGGKHTALNKAWDMAEGFFQVCLDADDELLPHSISFLVDEYFKIPEDIRDQYWCVHGRCETQYKDFVGERYPEGINANDWRTARKIASQCKGEKIGLERTDYLREYRFPEVVGVRHVVEGVVWGKINAKYGTWFTNEVVRVYYVNEGGNLTAKTQYRYQINAEAYWLYYQINNEELYGKSFKRALIYSIAYFVADKNYRKNNGYLKGLKRYKFILALLYPFSRIGAFLYRKIKKLK